MWTGRVMVDGASGQDCIVCLRCGSVSFNPNDIAQLYCGRCHRYHEEIMEQLLEFCGVKILLTTGASRAECQALDAWDKADIVISVVEKTARVLKGEPLLTH